MDEIIPKDLKVEGTPKPGTAPPMSLISPFLTEFESRNSIVSSLWSAIKQPIYYVEIVDVDWIVEAKYI